MLSSKVDVHFLLKTQIHAICKQHCKHTKTVICFIVEKTRSCSSIYHFQEFSISKLSFTLLLFDQTKQRKNIQDVRSSQTPNNGIWKNDLVPKYHHIESFFSKSVDFQICFLYYALSLSFMLTVGSS